MKRFLKGLLYVVLYSCGILILFIAGMFLFVEHDTTAFIIVGIIGCVFFVPAIILTIKDYKKKKAIEIEAKAKYEAKLQAEREKEAAWLAGDGKHFKKVIDNFWVDETNQKLRVKDRFIDWNKIIGSQIIDDDEIVTTSVSSGYQTSKRGSVGRAIAGGVLFGGVGAIVGANTGKQKTKIHTTTATTNYNYCKSLILRIFVDYVDEPYIDFPFIEHQLNKNDELYKTKNEEINKCNGIIKVILNRLDQ